METFAQRTQNQPVVKTGKRISKDDLLKYIETNKEVAKNINYVDLNETVSEKDLQTIEKTQFQTLSEVRYLPPNLASILKPNLNKYLHAGCLRTIVVRNGKQQTNLQISLLSSIMTCMYPQFSTMTVVNQTTFLGKLFERLKSEASGIKFTQFSYNKKYKWHKGEIEVELDKCSYDGKSLKYISDYFHINLFILDIERDQMFYPGDEYVPYKSTVFLLKFEDGIYEPLFFGNTRVFQIDSNLIVQIRKDLDVVNVINLSEKISMGLEEVEEDLKYYKPPQEKERVKIEKPEYIADKEKQEKLAKEKEAQVYDDSINAFSEGEECEEDNKYEIKQSTRSSESEKYMSDTESNNDEKPKKVTKKSLKVQKDQKKSKEQKEPKTKNESKKTSIDIKLSDIKSTLKIDELKTIAKKLGITTDKKTKPILMEEIKSFLSK